MSVFFIADLHLGHNNICKYEENNRGQCTNVEEHDEWIINRWNSVVTKSDLVWVLGDVAFNTEGLKKVRRLNGSKHLILGNHDGYSLQKYLQYFNKIHGFIKYKNMWLSHAPIHPASLRGLKNIHGHTHSWKPMGSQYKCVSVEQLNGVPLSLEEIVNEDI
jgi:calcineurin-like phosphoesterase family protein